MARWIAEKLNRSTSPLTVVIPGGGVSVLDAPGQPFYDADANSAFVDELTKQLDVTDQRRIVRSPLHINDPEFASLLVNEFEEVVAMKRELES